VRKRPFKEGSDSIVFSACGMEVEKENDERERGGCEFYKSELRITPLFSHLT